MTAGQPEDEATDPRGSEPVLPLLHCDERLVAIHKPPGIHTHPSPLSPGEDSAMRWLRDQLGRHVWPAHRLDRGASGLLLFALDPETATRLVEAFRERRVKKRYLALCRGWIAESGRETRPLAENDAAGVPVPREAETAWLRLQAVERPVPVGPWPTSRYSLVDVRPESGRTHQIRRHLAGRSHPLLGDGAHGDRVHNRALAADPGLGRLALVCVGLELAHPITGEPLRLETTFDPQLDRAARALGFDPAHWALTGGGIAPELLDGLPERPGRSWRRRAGRKARLASARAEADRGPDPAESIAPEPCPLCAGAGRGFHAEKGRHWLDCPTCGLVWLAAEQRPRADEELARYRLHRCDPADAGHRRFLAPLLAAIRADESRKSDGLLDFGSGEVSTLAACLREHGWAVTEHDPLWRTDDGALVRTWATIALCEVFEHFHDPARELERLDGLLEPGGRLLLHTAPLEAAPRAERDAFAAWSYRRDATHVVFLRPATAEWIAAWRGWRLERPDPKTFVYHKPGA